MSSVLARVEQDQMYVWTGSTWVPLTGSAGGILSSNISQFGGSNIVTGVGAAGSGVPRITASHDNVESTAPAGTSAATSYAVACAGMAAVGGNFIPSVWSGTYIIESSMDNGATYAGCSVVLNGSQYHFQLSGAIPLTTSSSLQDFHVIMGEGWTHVRLRVATSTAGTYSTNVRATMIVSPLAVGALASNSLLATSTTLWGNLAALKAITGGLPAAVTNGAPVAATGDVYGRTTIKKIDTWAINHTPAAATVATISQGASGNAAIKNVCTSISITLIQTATTAGSVLFNFRDGAAGAGTIKQAWRLACSATTGDSRVLTLDDLWIEGTGNTAMTIETSAAPGTGLQATVAMTGTITQ